MQQQLEFLNQHDAWVKTIWLGEDPLATRDLAVMTLGLVGESTEVSLAFRAAPWSEDLIIKELGDCSYYALRLASAFGLNSDALIGAGRLFDHATRPPGPAKQGVLLALCEQSGKIAELLKKYIRDSRHWLDADHGRFREALSQELRFYWKEWFLLCGSVGVRGVDVLQKNRLKLDSRLSRGVLRGSGDNR